MIIPTLRTARLTLDGFTFADAPAVQRLAGVPEVARTTLNIPHPYPDGAAEFWIATHALNFLRGEGVTFAIRKDGELVGAVGLGVNKAHERAELGYWLAVPWWNQGIMTEAAAEAVRFGFSHWGLRKVTSRHLAMNPASGRVMQKIGMAQEGVRRAEFKKDGVFHDSVEYGLLAENARG